MSGDGGGPTGLWTVVFDLGEVLVGWDPHGPYRGRMAPAQVRAYFDDIDFPAFNHRQDAGRPWAEARAEVVHRFPQHTRAFDLYLEHFADSLTGPVPGSEDLVRGLREAGVRLLGLTNWSAETFWHAERAAPAVGWLEDVLVSGEVGLAKPDRRIYEVLVERFGLERTRTVFVDDKAENVEAARDAGLHGVHFAGAAAAHRKLAALGVPGAVGQRRAGSAAG